MAAYFVLIKNNVPINYSSAVGSFCAIIFVYFASSIALTNKIERSKIQLILWIGYQAISIIIFSNAVNYLYAIGTPPMESKLATIPISFICNYVFINFILKI